MRQIVVQLHKFNNIFSITLRAVVFKISDQSFINNMFFGFPGTFFDAKEKVKYYARAHSEVNIR